MTIKQTGHKKVICSILKYNKLPLLKQKIKNNYLLLLAIFMAIPSLVLLLVPIIIGSLTNSLSIHIHATIGALV